MTVGLRASTERKEDQREVRGKMTLTVEYSEMTVKIVKHFIITATTSANWGIPARTQEEYKQKKNFSPRPHAHSHAFRHIRTLTHMTARMHTSTLVCVCVCVWVCVCVCVCVSVCVCVCMCHMSIVSAHCLWLFIMFAQCQASTSVFEIYHQQICHACVRWN